MERENVEMKKEKEGFFAEHGFEVIKLALASAILILSLIIPMHETVKTVMRIASALIVGYTIIIELFESIKEKEFFGENTLMTVASVTAFALGSSFEGAIIIILFSLGELLEDVATDNSRERIKSLSGLKIKITHVKEGENVVDKSPEEVEIGSIIEVKKGECVSHDGELLSDVGEFDLKTITGESKPVAEERGGKIYAGGVNLGDPVYIKTTASYKDSSVERIIALVEESSEKKAKSQKFIKRFAKIYTPTVAVLAILVAVIIPLIDGMNFAKWIYKALSFLIVSCPCALVISVPLGYFIGLGSLAAKGVLIKGANYIDVLAKTKTVVFDKTGTLTEGKFYVEKTEVFDENKGYLTALSFDGNGEDKCDAELKKRGENVLKIAASLESFSTHPVAKAVCSSFLGTPLKAENVKEAAGKGVLAEIEGKEYRIGNLRFISEKVQSPLKSDGEQVLYLSEEDRLIGAIVLRDKIKDGAPYTVRDLKGLGVERIAVLSGDAKKTVDRVADDLEIEEKYAELLPADKSEYFERIYAEKRGSVVYVGDGINDSPVLKRADVGVAMGKLGSEIATESADAVIMNDDIKSLPTAIRHAKKIRRVVIGNAVFSIGVKVGVMIVSLFTVLPLFVASFADVGVMMLAILNSMRNYRVKK